MRYALLAALAALVGSSLHGQDAPRISNYYYDTPLREILQDFSAQAGVPILADQQVNAFVTAEIKDAPLEQALETVLAGTGYGYTQMDGRYLVYTPDPNSQSFMDVAQTRRIQLNYLEANQVYNLLAKPLQRYVQQGESDGNLLSITAPPPILDRIVADIRQLDRPLPHVMLDARVVVLEQQLTSAIGVAWNFPGASFGGFRGDSTGGDWAWGLQVGYTLDREFTDALSLSLDLLSSNEEATIVASPRLVVQDGRKATIKVTTEEYFELVTDGYYARAELETIETGTILDITTRVGEDGRIYLDIEIEVSEVTARGDNNLPVVNRRKATSTVRVQDGGTVAIAGLSNAYNHDRLQKVPGVGDVPLLRKAFRHADDRSHTRQLAVFVTANIVDEDGGLKTRRPAKPVYDAVPVEAFRAQLQSLIERGE